MRQIKDLNYDIFLECIHCGMCLPHCPSYVVTGAEPDSPRGRIYLIKAAADERVDINKTVKHHFDTCLACRGCETACPSGVDFHSMLESMQEEINENVEGSAWTGFIKDFVLHEIFPDPERLKKAMGLIWFYQRSGIQKLVRKFGVLKLLPGNLDLSEQFLPEVRGRKLINSLPISSGNPGKRIGFLRGCVMDYFYPATNRATLNVLRKAGYSASVPEDQNCCGAVHLHNGDHDTAKELAKKNIDAFESFDIVISNAAGCGAAMKEYGGLLADDNEYSEKAVEFSKKVMDISEFLFDKIDPDTFKNIDMNIAFDIPCHLIHGQKISSQPENLLRSIPGLVLKPLHESEMCCGSGGTFNVTQPDLSLKVLERKMENVRKSGAKAIVTANIGCMIQLEKGVELFGPDLEIYHIIDLLDIALVE
ncbi:MAG: 4Fe-4S dicluster domain-containing protein [bacterium]|nr:4Fe-4S dicluster domain-containing protein [bacterium]